MTSRTPVRYVRILLTDVNGVSRGPIVKVEHYQKTIDSGMPLSGRLHLLCAIDGSIVGSDDDTPTFSDFFAYPDVKSLRILPWKPYVAEVMVDFRREFNRPDGPLIETVPRNICKMQMAKLADEMSMQLFSALEYEFITLKRDTFTTAQTSVDFMNVSDTRWAEDLMIEICDAQNIAVEKFHQELGPGQLELSVRPAFGTDAQDNAVCIKHTVKEVAERHGYTATFMSKFLPNQSGSSGHFNHSLWSMDGQSNRFFNKDENSISEIMQYWLGGLIHHALALQALFCPTVNCYRRTFSAGSFAPANSAWGFDNRTCAFRVKNYSESMTFIENRVPGAAANPYLVAAGCVIAGMDSIHRKLAPHTPVS